MLRCWLALAAGALGVVVGAHPQKRTYDTHHYYAAEIVPRGACADVTPEHVAAALDAEFVEQVGALPHHWLLKHEKGDALARRSVYSEVPEAQDPVLTRYAALRRRTTPHTKRCTGASCVSEACIADALRDVERQVPRQRHKRDVIYDPATMRDEYPELRAPVPATEAWMRPASGAHAVRAPVPLNVSAKLRDAFEIHDPLFFQQWHLANVEDPGHDLGLGQIWRNATGRGVTVSLLDDGLDFTHPDIKANFDEKGSYDFNDHTPLPEPRLSDDQHGTRCAGEIAAVRNDMCGIGVAPDAHVSAVRILSGAITDADEAAALNFAYDTNAIYSCSWGPPDNGKSMDAPKGLVAKALLNGIYNGRNGNGSIYVFAGGNGGASDDQCNFDGYTNSIYTVTIAAVDYLGHHPYYSEMCSAIIASSYSSGAGQAITTTDISRGGAPQCTSLHGGTSAAAPLVAGMLALVLELRPELTWRDVQHVLIAAAQPINAEDPDWETNGVGRKFSHKYGYGMIQATRLLAVSLAHKLVPPQAWLESPRHNTSTPRLELNQTSSVPIEVTPAMLEQANLMSLEHVTATVWIEHDRRGDVQVELFSPHGTRSVLASPRRYDSDGDGFPGWTFMSLKHWGEDMLGTWRLQVSDHADARRENRLPANFTGWSLTLWGAARDASKAKPWDFPEGSEEHSLTLSGAPSSTVLHHPEVTPTNTLTLNKPTHALPDDHHTRLGETHQSFGSHVQTPEADTGYLAGVTRHSTWLAVAAGVALAVGVGLLLFFYRRLRTMRRYEYLPSDENEIRLGTMPTDVQTRDLYNAFALDDDELDDDDNADAKDDQVLAPPSYISTSQEHT